MYVTDSSIDRLKGNVQYILREGNSVVFVLSPPAKGSSLKGNSLLSPSGKGSTLKGKNLLPLGAKSFLLHQTPFQKENRRLGEQTGSHKSCHPCFQ